MEASALHAPSLNRVPLGTPLLRLRSDEQLLALFRAGSEEAFGAIHDRYRQRLFAYVRQMLSKGPRQDAEDVMQDVFVRAYGALRADEREVLSSISLSGRAKPGRMGRTSAIGGQAWQGRTS